MLKFSGVEFDFSALVIFELRAHCNTRSFKCLNSSSTLGHLDQNFHFETLFQLAYTKLLSPGAFF